MLTQREISIAIIKATASQVPMVGPYIAETIAALDQRATLESLEARLEQLERLVLNLGGFDQRNLPPFRIEPFYSTRNYEMLDEEFTRAIESSESLQNFLESFAVKPSAEFRYFQLGIQIKFVHDMIERTNNLCFNRNAVATQALISIATSTLQNATEKDGFLTYTTTTTCEGELIRYDTYLQRSWGYLGGLFMETGKQIEAIRCYFRQIELGSEPRLPLLNIANCFYSLGAKEYAAEKYQKLAESYPFSIQVRNRYAEAMYELGRFSEVEAFYKLRIAEMEPTESQGEDLRASFKRAWIEDTKSYISKLKQ